MGLLGRGRHGLRVGEGAVRVDADQIGARNRQRAWPGARRQDERPVADPLAAGELDLVLVRVDRRDGRLQPDLHDGVLPLGQLLQERRVPVLLPRRNPFVSGGRWYGGSGSAERIVTSASPPLSRYSAARRPAARPPPTTTIESVAMRNAYPVRIAPTHERYAGAHSSAPFSPWPC
jgi:hypothetical protein